LSIRVELDLPDWCRDSWLYLMKGIELVAYQFPGEPWKVKTGRCSMCGKCCPPNPRKPRCEHLKKVGSVSPCSLGSERPWSCSVFMPGAKIEGCTEAFE
jgi:hypothetical protein